MIMDNKNYIQTKTTNNNVVNDFLVTHKIDTQSISEEQLKRDLELLKTNEVIMQSRANTPLLVKKKRILPRTLDITDVDVLKLGNPFKGE